MKSNNTSNGFSVIEVFVIIVILVIIGAVGLVAFHAISAKNQPHLAAAATSTPAPTSTRSATGSLSLNESELLPGWAAHYNTSSLVGLDNQTLHCNIDVISTHDQSVKESDAKNVADQQYRLMLAGAKNKGYTVTELPSSTITVATDGMSETVPTYEVDYTGPNNLSESYGYVVKNGYYVEIGRICNSRSDLQSTVDMVGEVIVHE